jgi:hypothetical protein
MKARDFFDEVCESNLSQFDMLNMVEDMTDHFDELKLNLLCNEFDFYCFMKKEEWFGRFEDVEAQKAMHKLEREGEKVPMEKDSDGPSLSVSYFFEQPKIKAFLKRKKDLTAKQKKDRDDLLKEMDKMYRNTIDIEKLIATHEVDYFSPFRLRNKEVVEFHSLFRLRNILIKLKKKHTDAVYRFDDKDPQVNIIQPIHWLKGVESLRQFIELLKSAGFIENRETEEIIQEHFDVDGQKPTKEPEPIVWEATKVLLAHLINDLDSINAIKADHIWKVTAPHFEWNGKTPSGLRQSVNNNPYPNDIEKIESILKVLKERK